MLHIRLVITLFVLLVVEPSFGQSTAQLSPARPVVCTAQATSCEDFDAIVFVHGIYGDKTTFINPDTKFNWPQEMPASFLNRKVDVFVLSYQTELLKWLKAASPKFDTLVLAVYDTLKPLRTKRYRSIGFIAHSLGGSVVPAYISYVKSIWSHPGSSQHAYVISLATPVLGSQLADAGGEIKQALGFSADPLLESLRKDNQLLRMLLAFRKGEDEKRKTFGCRPISLHAAYEEKQLGPFLVVNRESAELSVAGLTSSQVVGFPLNHFSIVKPLNKSHDVYKWVHQRIDDEFVRLSEWDKVIALHPPQNRLCVDIPRKPEA